MDTDSSMFDNGAAVDTTAFDSAFAPVAGPSSKPAFFQLQESSSEGGSSASGSEYEESEEEMQEDNVPADEAQEAAGGTGKSTDEDNLE